MIEVNLKQYAKMLLDKTVSGEYVWETNGDDKYRLLLGKGTVVLSKIIYGGISNYLISFYDTATLIYSGSIDRTNTLYSDYSELYDTIISKNNEKINNSIMELFS